MDIITRKEALELGLSKYYTGKPCKHGHLSERYTKSGACVECQAKITKEYGAKWREANKDKIAEYNRRWSEANREKRAENQRKYREANPDKITSNKAKRRSAKLNRTPAWADLDMIDVFYALAREMSEETGIPHHVDHIIPLQGENVSGLHVSINLQVIPAEDNLSKGNGYTP